MWQTAEAAWLNDVLQALKSVIDGYRAAEEQARAHDLRDLADELRRFYVARVAQAGEIEARLFAINARPRGASVEADSWRDWFNAVRANWAADPGIVLRQACLERETTLDARVAAARAAPDDLPEASRALVTALHDRVKPQAD